MSKVLAVVPSYVKQPKDLELHLACLEGLAASAPDADVLVIDDCSPAPALVDEIEAASERLHFELVRKDKNEGFSRTVNYGLRRALSDGMDAVLVNADIEFVEKGWLDVMQAQPTEDGEGLASIVGALLLYPSGLIQHAGIFFSLLEREFAHIYNYAPGDLPEAQEARVCPVTGALQFIRHECLAGIGVYDEHFRMGFEDVDYCIRAFQSGRECVMQPRARAFHHESVFRGQPSPKIADWQARSWIHFMQKYKRTSFVEYVPSLL